MKIAPVSGDLLVKLAVVGLVIGAGVYALQQLLGKVPSPGKWWDTAADVAQAFNPANPGNVINTAANAGLSAAVGYDENWGGWLYDKTHRDPVNPWQPPAIFRNTPPAAAPGVLFDPTYDAMGNRTN